MDAVVSELLELARSNSLTQHASNLVLRLFDDPDRAAALLTPALADPSRAVRRYAISLLMRIHRTAPVMGALGDHDESIRLAACGALVEDSQADPTIRRAVLDCLYDPTMSPSSVAIQIRVKLHDPQLGAYLEVCRHVPQLLESAIGAMRNASDGAARLVALTRDPDPRVRWHACAGFGYAAPTDVPDDEIRAALVERLDDHADDDRIVHIATSSLKNYPDVALEPRLLSMLPNGDAVTTLARWQSQLALPAILELARTGHYEAIKALAEYPPSAAIEAAWIDALASEAADFYKYTAADLLSQHGSSTAVPTLEQYLAKDVKKASKRWRKDAQRRIPGRIALLRKKAPLA